MKQTDLSRRAFLLGLGAVSSAALLSACNTNAPVNSGPTPSQPESEPAEPDRFAGASRTAIQGSGRYRLGPHQAGMHI